MSNLGAYQTMTTIAKKVGGAREFISLIFLSGGLTALMVEKGIKTVKSKIIDIKKASIEKRDDKIYVVSMSYSEENGLNFNVGDEYRILASDGEAVLIEVMGDDNNPYFVSEEVLSMISNYYKNP